MKTSLIATLVVGLLIAALEGKDNSAKEATKLEGTWSIISVVRKNNPLPEDRLKDAWFIFQGENYSYKQAGKTLVKGTFRIESGTIDLVAIDGEKKETTFAIYELEGDVLRICGARPGQERPMKFAADDGTDHSLITFKRAKP